tara:strand:+ start:97581 stop:97697 length:117 start_codon:yes stop_codon:yes gene_type:complete
MGAKLGKFAFNSEFQIQQMIYIVFKIIDQVKYYSFRKL